MRKRTPILALIASIFFYCIYFNIPGYRFHPDGSFYRKPDVGDSVAFVIPVAPKHFDRVKDFIPYFQKSSSNVQLVLVFTNDREQQKFIDTFGFFNSTRYLVLDPKFAINDGTFSIK